MDGGKGFVCSYYKKKKKKRICVASSTQIC